MNEIKSVLYVSLGNLPSKLASSIQVAKMSQALSQKVAHFALVTGGDLASAIRKMDAEFQNWYGLQHQYNLIRIPLHFQVKYPFPKNYSRKLYFKLAVLYAYLKSPTFVYSRSIQIVAPLLKLGVPVLWERHEMLPDILPDHSIYRQVFASKKLIGLVTLSPAIAENYLKNGLDPDKVLIAHSGVDTGTFLPYLSQVHARQKLQLNQKEKIVLYAGHLYEHKGIATILETANLMPETTFLLVGGWQGDIAKVKATCTAKNLHNVNIVGHVEQTNLAVYLYAADILLLPTSQQWELAQTTSPLKLFEYMSVRRPIVASALNNIMTVLRDRENALLAKPDDPRSFQQAIAELLANPDLAQAIGDRALTEVKQYTWDSRADSVLQFATQQLEKIKAEHSLPKKL
ncbi:MAG: glycosyltransferase [Cyanobacteria bacterium J06629_2]